MPREKPKALTEKHFITVIGLLGLDEMGFPRTQSQVVKLTGYPRNSISTYVKFLVDEKYLIETKNSGREKFYGKGSKYPLIESQITDDLIHQVVYAKHCRLNQESYNGNEVITEVTPEPKDIFNDSGSLVGENCPIAFDIHQSGSWIQFRVEKTGELFYVDMKRVNPNTGRLEVYQQTIFPKKSEWEFDGGINWITPFVLSGTDSNRFKIRYHQTETKAYFYVLPLFDVLATPDEVTDQEMVRTKFILACTPLLRWFEKNAGWVFMKDEFGRYQITSKIKVDEIHKALRGPINDMMVDVTGGVFGRSEEGIWCDCSPGSPEIETTQAAYVEAVVKLPETRVKADVAYERVGTIDNKIVTIDNKIVIIQKDFDSLLNLVIKLMKTNEQLTQIVALHTENQAKLLNVDLEKKLSENQMKLADYYQPKEQPKNDRTDKEPPEGYR